MKMKWNVPYCYIPGSRHLDAGSESQDNVLAKLTDDFVCVVMADGAGSVKNGGEGAKLVTNVARSVLVDWNTDIFDMTEDSLREELITELKIQLHELAREKDCEFESFASTFLFFAADGKRFLAGNLGDGLIGVINEQNQAETLLAPENGNFLNESFFVTDDDCINHLRLISGKYSLSNIYFLMTDGSCDCLYDRNAKTFADALSVFADWTRRYDHRAVTDALRTTMYKLFTKRTLDDCAIALIRGEKKEVKGSF